MTAAPADTPPTTNPEPTPAPALSAAPEQGAISRTTKGADEEQSQTMNALRLAHAQLGAVITAVQAGTDCRTLITQLSAVQTALNKAGFSIISTEMRDCLARTPADETPPGALSLEEIRKLFLTLT